jgi:hypothetical protein
LDIIRPRAEHLRTVVAPNEKEAIKTAIAIYQIERARRNRITVATVSDKDDNEGWPLWVIDTVAFMFVRL